MYGSSSIAAVCRKVAGQVELEGRNDGGIGGARFLADKGHVESAERVDPDPRRQGKIISGRNERGTDVESTCRNPVTIEVKKTLGQGQTRRCATEGVGGPLR